MKALKTLEGVNDVAVDIKICERLAALKDEPIEVWKFIDSPTTSFEFEEVAGWSKDLWFRNYRNECLVISLLKEGLIKVEAIAGDHIKDFVKTISR